MKRDRDGSQDGMNGSEDVDSIDDQNFSLAKVESSETVEVNIRWNDRSSDRVVVWVRRSMMVPEVS